MPTNKPNAVIVRSMVNQQVHKLPSYGAAAKFIREEKGDDVKVDTSTIRWYLQKRKSLHGWLIEPDTEARNASLDKGLDVLSFVFEEEAGDMFKGKTVRVTPDKKVSVLDIISVVTEAGNPRKIWKSMCETHSDIVTFSYDVETNGLQTMKVVNIEGMMHIINLLPGPKAAAFRAGAMRLLVRFLGGDVSLIPKVHAIADHHASGASCGTIEGMCNLHVTQQQTQMASLPHVIQQKHCEHNKYAFMSPSMVGRDLHDYQNKEVCYLVRFVVDGIQYLKFGRTEDACKRMCDHARELPQMQLYFMLDTSNARDLECQYRKKMRYNGKLTDVVINGKRQTEVLVGISSEKAEAILTQLHEASYASDDEQSLKYKLASVEGNVRMKELDARVKEKELDVELRKMDMRMKVIDMLANNANMMQYMDVIIHILI